MKRIDELNNLIEQAIKNKRFPGANYVLVIKDQVYYGSFGYKSLIPEPELNTLDTMYDLASLTKVIGVVTTILKLMESGKLCLSTSAKKYLPRLQDENITIWHLMTHTSGFPAGVSGVKTLKDKNVLLDKIYNTPLIYETGSKICYSDLNYILLGFIIEKITNLPLDQAITNLVFKPLEMHNTMYCPQDPAKTASTEVRNGEVTRGVVHDETAALLDGISGNAGVFSTVFDLGHFMEMILHDGLYNGQPFLSKASIDLIYTPQVFEPDGVKLTVAQRSLGWLVGGRGSNGDLTSPKTIHHTGFTGTNIFIDRLNQVGFCLLTNCVHPSRNNSCADIRAQLANFIMAHYQDDDK